MGSAVEWGEKKGTKVIAGKCWLREISQQGVGIGGTPELKREERFVRRCQIASEKSADQVGPPTSATKFIGETIQEQNEA